MTARTRCRGCQRLTHVAEMLYVPLPSMQFRDGAWRTDDYLFWRCARCVEDARAGKKVSTT